MQPNKTRTFPEDNEHGQLKVDINAVNIEIKIYFHGGQ